MARCLNVDPAEFDGGPNLYWYISDALSTVRLVVDGAGAVVASYASDEFGNQTAATGSADLRQHTYTGSLGVRDDGAALGLLDARHRYYDPSVGRWLNQDPVGFAGGLNLYTYVGNSPVGFVDPEGLAPWVKVWRLIKKGKKYGTEFVGKIKKRDKAKLNDMLDSASCPPQRGPGWEHKGIHIQNKQKEKIKKVVADISDDKKVVVHKNAPQQGPGEHYHPSSGKWSEKGSTRVHGSTRPPLWMASSLGTATLGLLAPRVAELSGYSGEDWSPSFSDYASAAAVDLASWLDPVGAVDVVVP